MSWEPERESESETGRNEWGGERGRGSAGEEKVRRRREWPTVARRGRRQRVGMLGAWGERHDGEGTGRGRSGMCWRARARAQGSLATRAASSARSGARVHSEEKKGGRRESERGSQILVSAFDFDFSPDF